MKLKIQVLIILFFLFILGNCSKVNPGSPNPGSPNSGSPNSGSTEVTLEVVFHGGSIEYATVGVVASTGGMSLQNIDNGDRIKLRTGRLIVDFYDGGLSGIYRSSGVLQLRSHHRKLHLSVSSPYVYLE